MILTALLVVATPAPGQVGEAEPALHAHGLEHPPLTADETLTLADVLDHAAANYPGALELAARAAEAGAWEDRGQDWLADRPSLFLRYQTDRWGDDEGLDEYEAGILLPLWSWGGRAATRDFGQALMSESAAAAPDLRWELAGRLRELVWDIALANNEVELAQESSKVAQRLAETVARRQALGDLPLSDVLLAQATALEAQTELAQAEARRVDAERAYRTLTGLDRRPLPRQERLSPAREIGPDHPGMTIANARLRRAEAARELADRASGAGPDLLIGPRRERAADGNDFDDSIGLSVNIPFGASSRRRVEVAAAEREVEAARAARLQWLRSQTLALHEAAHGLELVGATLEASRQRAELAGRHYRMGASAHEKGELDLTDLLKLQRTAFAARRHAQRLTLEQGRWVALYNQAVGVLP
jgi:cobalt-zinc-cadmium efflux system outer membrane protein